MEEMDLENVLNRTKSGYDGELSANNIERVHKEGYITKISKGSGISYLVNKNIYAKRFDANGREKKILLVSANRRIRSREIENIIRFNLWERLEKSISINGCVTRDAIVSYVKRLNEPASIHRILFETGKADLIEEVIKRIDFDKITLDHLNLLHEHVRGDECVAHVENTAVLCIKMGIGLGITPDELTRIGQCAILHDIGKAAIRSDILEKPKSQLSKAEWRHIKVVPILGEYILMGGPTILNKKYPENVIRGVGDCHEHLDGSGYPRGIQGASVGMFARLVAVASQYDNMVREGFKSFDSTNDNDKKLTIIQNTFKCLKQRAIQGWYDPVLVDMLSTFYTPVFASGEEDKNPAKEIAKIQQLFQGIEIATSIILNLQLQDLNQSAWASPFCDDLSTRVYGIQKSVREAGISDPVLGSVPCDVAFMKEIRAAAVTIVSEIDTPIKKIEEVILRFENNSAHADDSLRGIIHAVSTWYDVMKRLKDILTNRLHLKQVAAVQK